jgi:4-amino-4-deoxy-L-arabinose transferase-like glycosyltransferase
VAWPTVAVPALGVVALLLATAGRYGYHRDELYFLRAGRELAWGYADQPPLTPLLARLADTMVPGSLVALRVPSALSAGLVVLLAALTAREFGSGRAGQVLAACCTAVASVVLAVGHLLSTTSVDLLAWAALGWLLVRALRDGGRVWLAAGAVAGVALENKTLPVSLLAAVLAGVLVAGPRRALASPWPWAAGVLAALLWAPDVAWQAAHGFPQLALSRAIAAGGSGTSSTAAAFWPTQLGLVSPLLVPVWVTGWWRLVRDPALRTWRAFAVAFVLLGVLFPLTGGKPYYLAGLYPLLLAAGADPVLRWAARGRARWRRRLLAAALALSLLVDSLLFLPLIPVRALAATPVPAVDYDAGETVGWPALAASIARVRDTLPADAPVVVLTRNYGEAGAVDRYLPALSPAYSGHNSYADWGPPPESATTAVVVGYEPAQLTRWFGSVRLAARVDDGVGLDNDEQGAPVVVATARRAPWAELWPSVRHLG